LDLLLGFEGNTYQPRSSNAKVILQLSAWLRRGSALRRVAGEFTAIGLPSVGALSYYLGGFAGKQAASLAGCLHLSQFIGSEIGGWRFGMNARPR